MVKVMPTLVWGSGAEAGKESFQSAVSKEVLAGQYKNLISLIYRLINRRRHMPRSPASREESW